MPTITRESLMSLETYARERPRFRARVIEHKKRRYVCLGSNVTLTFEDELTIRYQIQEMLHAERIFEDEGITAELEAYSPLVPDGSNLKATMLIQYVDPHERVEMLGKLIGIEDAVWLEVAGCARVYAIADEDLPRENEVKTSAVHFLRFELEPSMIGALKGGGALSAGIDHPHYGARLEPVDAATATALAQDLTG
ncbi:MAG: hypothetical protein JWN13_2148 [Betaproteobacteria bacterium]|jgi:hypothetical protein|nr:hypothetical protein [Betaproteobacteria bacterium]